VLSLFDVKYIAGLVGLGERSSFGHFLGLVSDFTSFDL